MNAFERVDTKMLSFFTKISHKFEQATGKTNLFLANICLGIFALFIVMTITNYWSPIFMKETDRILLILALLSIGWITIDSYIILSKENGVDGNSLKIRVALNSNIFSRMLTLFLVLSDTPAIILILAGKLPVRVGRIIEIIHYTVGFSLCGYFYLIQVSPLPQGQTGEQTSSSKP